MRLSAIIAVSLMLFALRTIPLSAQDAPQPQPKTEPQASSKKPSTSKTEKSPSPVTDKAKPAEYDQSAFEVVTGVRKSRARK